jgi:hypothetical protein
MTSTKTRQEEREAVERVLREEAQALLYQLLCMLETGAELRLDAVGTT